MVEVVLHLSHTKHLQNTYYGDESEETKKKNGHLKNTTNTSTSSSRQQLQIGFQSA
jgi:hypothetical protein